MNEYLKQHYEEFQKSIDFFKKEISGLNVGRAKPALVENVPVQAYGIKNTLNTIASINVVDSKSLTVLPWDKNIMKEVEKSIVEADLGVSVMNEGDKIRVNIPDMTEEKRKEIVKKLKEKYEQGRVSIRQVREDVKEEIEKACDNKDISEDEKFRFLEELEETVKEFNDKLEEIKDKKEQELMTV